RTRNHGHYVCSTWGNNHFKTFDGDIYQFPGMCEYNFVSDCQDSYRDFSVHIQRALNSNNHPEIQYILITVADFTVYLKPKLAVVDGRIVKTPYYSSGLLIESNDIYTKVYAKIGLILIWNQEDALMVELDSKFGNQTCGLCGDYNGVPIYNEFISADASYNSITYGNLQKISKPNDECEDPDETQALPSCNEHRDECEKLLTSSAFADCQSRLNLETYIQACMQDKCACKGSEDAFCLCSTISEYSRQCSHAGGRPGEWRTENFCCKHHFINKQIFHWYSTLQHTRHVLATWSIEKAAHPAWILAHTWKSAAFVRNTTWMAVSALKASVFPVLYFSSVETTDFRRNCNSLLFCFTGTVYDDITENGCIPVSQCYCKLHGKGYSPGETITNECEECTCDSGRWTCKDLPCPGRCSVEGGSHITTFDGKKYTFHGDCYYVLAKSTVNNTHALLAELAPCGSTDGQTCLKTVVLLVDDKKNVVVFRSDGSVSLNEMTVNVPHVSGLCGNFNGMEGDDFRTTNGLVEATGSAFANTWKAQSTCTDQAEKLEDPCSLSIESANYAEHWCSLLKDSEGPFARCHSVIDPSEYYKRCKYDTCLCKDSEECLCAALSSYSRACAFKGIILGGWRQSVCSDEVSACPGNQIFLYNLTMCQQTCRSIADGEKYCLQDFAPVDGCGCPDNMYLDNEDTCVPISKCPCYYKGSYLEPGEYVTKDGERCVCRNAKVQCTSVTMRMKSITECTSNKTYFDCNAFPGWTSQTPVQLRCGTSQNDLYQGECVSGCVCPEGLFDDGRGGCVEEEDCPCIHNNDWYNHGQSVTVDCNTCTCQKGIWSCTENMCYGTCMIYGSGHYITFDGKFYDFDGSCEYAATQDYCGGKNSGGSFSIITENVPCGTTGVTCSKAIKMFIGKTELKLENKDYKEIQRDVGDDVYYQNRTVGLYLVIEASNGVMLIWDKKTTVFIKLTPDYKGKVCGLCGNFDDTSNNDFTSRSGLQETSALTFGNSWKQSSVCPDVTEEIKPCDLKPHRKSWAEKECSLILSEIFKICHSKVNPSPFYEACVHDACSCDSGGDCDCFCSAVAAYAQECAKAQACVFWRSPDICPIFCDYYNPRNECEWHYEPCGSNVMTCRMIYNVSTNFSVPYLEGCYPRCPHEKPIYNEETNECVAEDECWCYHNGNPVIIGGEIPTEENCTKCVCRPSGSIECTRIPGCPCVINGTSYDVGETVATVTNGDICTIYVCAENGSLVSGPPYLCPSTTSPSTITTSPGTSTLTTSTTATTSPPVTTILNGAECKIEFFRMSSVSSGTEPGSFLVAPCLGLICDWSEWFDVSNPEKDDGDYETYEEIRTKHGDKICEAPENIECRAKESPDKTLEELGQKVECNVTYGLICKNEEQDASIWRLCYNYEIRVNCCEWREIPCEPTSTPSPTPTATSVTTGTTVPTTTTQQSTTISTVPPPTATTSKPTPSVTTPVTSASTVINCDCIWTDWIDVSQPDVSDVNSGDYETFDKLDSCQHIHANTHYLPNTSNHNNGRSHYFEHVDCDCVQHPCHTNSIRVTLQYHVWHDGLQQHCEQHHQHHACYWHALQPNHCQHIHTHAYAHHLADISNHRSHYFEHVDCDCVQHPCHTNSIWVTLQYHVWHDGLQQHCEQHHQHHACYWHALLQPNHCQHIHTHANAHHLANTSNHNYRRSHYFEHVDCDCVQYPCHTNSIWVTLQYHVWHDGLQQHCEQHHQHHACYWHALLQPNHCQHIHTHAYAHHLADTSNHNYRRSHYFEHVDRDCVKHPCHTNSIWVTLQYHVWHDGLQQHCEQHHQHHACYWHALLQPNHCQHIHTHAIVHHLANTSNHNYGRSHYFEHVDRDCVQHPCHTNSIWVTLQYHVWHDGLQHHCEQHHQHHACYWHALLQPNHCQHIHTHAYAHHHADTSNHNYRRSHYFEHVDRDCVQHPCHTNSIWVTLQYHVWHDGLQQHCEQHHQHHACYWHALLQPNHCQHIHTHAYAHHLADTSNHNYRRSHYFEHVDRDCVKHPCHTNSIWVTLQYHVWHDGLQQHCEQHHQHHACYWHALLQPNHCQHIHTQANTHHLANTSNHYHGRLVYLSSRKLVIELEFTGMTWAGTSSYSSTILTGSFSTEGTSTVVESFSTASVSTPINTQTGASSPSLTPSGSMSPPSVSTVPSTVTTSGTTPTKSFTTTSGTTSSSFSTVTATTVTMPGIVSSGSTVTSGTTPASSTVTVSGSSTYSTVTTVSTLSSTASSGFNCTISPDESYAAQCVMRSVLYLQYSPIKHRAKSSLSRFSLIARANFETDHQI
ncbi:UNVERIFIED_CONTAM: hypothetical protein H355_006208, partial [Colinus virginianus]